MSPFRKGEDITRGQAKGTQPATPPAYKDSSPIRDCTSPGPRDGRSRGSEWCHLQEDDPLRAPHPLKDGGPGTGLDQFEGAKDRGVPVEDGPRTGHRLRIQGELRAYFS